MENEQIDVEISKRRWANRRRMSWISFFYLVASGTAPFLFNINEAYIPLITNTQFLFFGIVCGYIGGNVIEHIKRK